MQALHGKHAVRERTLRTTAQLAHTQADATRG